METQHISALEVHDSVWFVHEMDVHSSPWMYECWWATDLLVLHGKVCEAKIGTPDRLLVVPFAILRFSLPKFGMVMVMVKT